MSASPLDLAKTRPVLMDGGLGTELMARGLPQGVPPESWNLERPDQVAEVHRLYFEAGADIVSTNSFGASPIKLAGHGLEARAAELNKAAARLARGVAPPGKGVAGSLGPTGKFLKPQGELTEEDLTAAFAEQASALAEGGADLLLVETQYDLREALCAVAGAGRAAAGLPVFVTMTFNALPKGYFTLMGDGVEKCVRALAGAGASALGANCTLDSEGMVEAVKALRAATTLPLIAQANAGRPVLGAEGCVSYSQGLEDYVRFVPDIVKAGADFVGGCCGTTPEYIRAMAEKLFRRGS